MANVGYPLGMKAMLDALVDYDDDTIQVALIDTETVSYNAGHQYYSSVQSGVVGSPGTIANTSTTGGVFDGDDVTLTDVEGDPAAALVIFKSTGSAASSPLLWWIDTGVTGLPVTPNGGDITIQWDADGIFELG